MRIDSVELREIHLPLVHYFETSFGRTYTRKIILVAVQSGHDIGYGECTAAEEPLYNSETTETAWHILSDFLVPRVLGKDLRSATEAAPLFGPIRGNRMARGALETALWELEARRIGIPLARHLGGVRDEIECGVSIGIQDSIEELLVLVRREIAAGYRRIKIKIKPGWELEPLRAIRREFPSFPLMVDANSAFQPSDLALLQMLDEFIQKAIQTPICLDESIHHAEDARKAVELGSCRIINVKLGRVGGYAEALKINDYCSRNGIPLWCGGMLESGVGRAHNIAMSTLAGFTLPGDVSASKRYYVEDTVNPPVTVSPQGTIRVTDSPGIGYELDWDRIRRATVRATNLTMEGAPKDAHA